MMVYFLVMNSKRCILGGMSRGHHTASTNHSLDQVYTDIISQCTANVSHLFLVCTLSTSEQQVGQHKRSRDQEVNNRRSNCLVSQLSEEGGSH